MSRTFNPEAEAQKDPFGLLPLGTYACRIADLEKKKGAKDDYLNTELSVLAGPMATHPVGVKSPYAARKLWDILSYSPNAMAKLGQAFIAVGHPQPPRDLDDMREMRDEVFLGRVVMVEVKHETYNNEEQAKVRRWKAAPADVLKQYPHQPPGTSHIPGNGNGESAAVGVPSGTSAASFDDDSDIPF